MPTIAHTFASAHVFLIKDGYILLSRRYNTGFEDGNYSLPAGHVEPGETFTQAAIREAREEVGVILTEEQLKISHITHRKNSKREYVDSFFTAVTWSGEPKNTEGEKCDDVSWFPLTSLPENMVPYVRQAIESSLKGVFYSEFGWK